MMTIKKTARGITIRLTEFPTTAELLELNSLGSNEYFMCESRGYKRLLVRSYGSDCVSNVMECPINEHFRD